MTLVLQGIALNDEPMSQPLIGRFDERGGTLGRSESATFTLPDPQRLISRIQAQVLFQDEGYWIENMSAATSTLHNGRPLSAGMRVLLRDGDELRVGGYTLAVAFEDDEVSASILRGRTSIIQPETLIAPKAATAATQKPWSPEQPWSERTLILQPRAPVAEPNTAPAAAQKLMSPAESPRSSQVQAASFVMPSDALPAVPMSGPAGGLPQPLAEPAGAQRVLSDEPLWRAFLEGAGIDLPNRLSPEFMKLVGTLLRIAIEGTHQLITMRATAKEEIQAEMTRIQRRDNNPLKFAPDGAAALQFLLHPPARGFLAGPTALQETMIDLQSHQVAMTAGMLSAVEALLDRFDPSKVEADLSTGSVFDSFRPTHRRARLWELYVEHYHALREDAQEAFKRLCAEDFRKAYEEAQGRSTDAAHSVRD